MQKTVCFATLGCKVNQYDTQAMLELFEASGYRAVNPSEPADVCVVNTCTVTGTGDHKSMQLARRMARRNPGAALVITGCLAQRLGAELKGTGARLILGTRYRSRVVELLEKAIYEDTCIVAVDGLENAPYEPLTISGHEGHTRAVMKIEDGCDNRCTYCIIPSVRGNVCSRPIEDIHAEAVKLADAGFRELVLTGIHLTSYGRDLEGRPTLADAIRAADVDGVLRLRLGSLEPRVANESFVAAIAEMPKLCPQFHLALQSGSDAVLRRMKRGYNTRQFTEAVERIRNVYPQAAFTTDVIVGFPGETEEEFAETLDFCERIGFAKLHVFPFSPREGTPAAEMPDGISKSEKEDRVRRLMALGDKLALRFREARIGGIEQVLLEERREDGFCEGYTAEYVQVRVMGGTPGELVNVRLDSVDEEGMHGTLVE